MNALITRALQGLRWVVEAGQSGPNRSQGDEHQLPTPAGLLSLPNELLDHIVNYLNTNEAGCLSLVNHSLCSTMSPSVWPELSLNRKNIDSRQEFLLALSKDHPKYFFCHTCSHLHLVINVGLPRYDHPYPYAHPRCVTNASITDLPIDCFTTHRLEKLYRLTFQHVQLAMLRHRHGSKYGIALSRLSTKEVQAKPTRQAATLLSIEASVIMDTLYLRVQQWIVFNDRSLLDMESVGQLSVCSHSNHILPSASLLECKLRHHHPEPGCPMCHSLLLCTACLVEFQIELFPFGSGMAFVLTKWLNLGHGESPTDSAWRRHLYDSRASNPVFKAADRDNGVAQYFDLAAGTPTETLTRENASIFLDGEYRRRLKPLDGYQSLWVAPVD